MLPSAPTQVHITNVESEFALLHWSPPKTLGDTVTSYNVHIRPVNSENEEEDDEDEPEFKVNEQLIKKKIQENVLSILFLFIKVLFLFTNFIMFLGYNKC